jgi:hypothetical protein
MITLNEIRAGDLVQLVDQRGNTASGIVLVDATRGRLCIRAFGVMVPFASETPSDTWLLTSGIEIVGHTGSLLWVAEEGIRCPELFARQSGTASGGEPS